MAGCNYDCENCSSKCEKKSFLEKANPNSNIKNIIAVMSGKGGVGKSLVAGLLASALNNAGLNVGIIDADVTGPSIPKMFGVKGTLYQNELGIIPNVSTSGVKMVSANFIVKEENDPVVWRGPLVASLVKQFYKDVAWGDLDYLIIDCPPGTGDVPLTVFQSIPINDIIVVTTPQELVSMIVSKAVKMAKMMNINILGVVENMSYVKCPNCDEIIEIYGPSKINEITKSFNLDVLAKLPFDKEIAIRCDNGTISDYNNIYFIELVRKLLQ